MVFEKRYRVVLGFKSNKDFSENPILLSDKMTTCIDVNSRVSIRNALNDVKHFGGTVDILVNNAGIAQEKNFSILQTLIGIRCLLLT